MYNVHTYIQSWLYNNKIKILLWTFICKMYDVHTYIQSWLYTAFQDFKDDKISILQLLSI